MKNYQLIGEKLAHSFSKEIHGAFSEYCYDLKEIAKEDLESFVKKCELDGFNVTIPYKKAIIPYLDKIDDVAKNIGAVNTVVIKDGKKFGYNTDFYGFEYLLKHCDIELENKKVLILGSGGTSQTVQAVAKHHGAKEIVVVSRSGENNYQNISRHSDADVVVNTTPVGMFPNNYDSVIDISDFKNLSGVVDVIYNPMMTKLLYDAKKRKINYSNGLPMLVAQAKYSRDLFMGNKISDDIIDEILIQQRRKLANILLIGMPGSGKTSVGEEIAKRLGRQFFDTDAMIIERNGKSIMEVFAERGEEFFRSVESETMLEIGKKNGIVIATGGGIVKTDANDFAMQQNCFVVYVDRDIDRLARNGRPLSKDVNTLAEIYRERQSKYHTWSDFVVQNDKSINDCVKKIMEKYDECIAEKINKY
ncbi:MAG: shikimate kinase [Clostridia bacterium]